MESKENIVLIHKECGKTRRKDFQKKFDKYSLEIGGFVKKDFIEGNKSEHMWVEITSFGDGFLMGILDNEPIILERIKLGDGVRIKLNEIEDYLSNGDNKKRI